MPPIKPFHDCFYASIEVDLLAIKINALDLVTDASKMGLFCQFFISGSNAWCRIVGPYDAVDNFRTLL